MFDFKEKSVEQLQQRLSEIAVASANMKAQVQGAKTKALLTGEYSDPNWFQSITYGLRMNGREQQAIQFELGNRKRNKEKNFERIFVCVARRVLDKETFDAIEQQSREDY